ncbi:hypothetical protein [Chamaesiphon sp. GL140_3_metabinner_50]|uniref:hypothetical protein n=1 Tax=Chamaesiphon sp. GL140_3_metabinner_50 TaxID=2970812 RepID=UPI0025E0E964|nr:hypothetical protein [Chamaesiphon sp. GL140_3_metabinner_50]
MNLDRFSNLLQNRGTRSGDAIELLVLSACQTARAYIPLVHWEDRANFLADYLWARRC